MTSNRRDFLKRATAGFGSVMEVSLAQEATARQIGLQKNKPLTKEHQAAVNRQRRIIVNYDNGFGAPDTAKIFGSGIEKVVAAYFSMIDEKGVQIDSVWWCWLDGNYANYPSKILPVWDHPGLRKWWQAGIDPVRIFAEETRKRGLEAFFSYRLNGTDMDSIQPLTKPLDRKSVV